MAEVRIPRYFLFKVLLVVGGLVGSLLLVQSVRSYRFVSQRLIEEELFRDTARQLGLLLQTAQEFDVHTVDDLKPVIETVLDERRDEIAWIRILDLRGEVLLSAGDPSAPPCTPQDVAALLSGERIAKVIETPAKGTVLVSLRPLRIRFFRRPPAPGETVPPATSGTAAPVPRRPLFVETALYWDAVGPEFGGLRQAMIIQISAAIALLASMAVIGLRFRNYVRGKQLEQQLLLARNVQQDLLPTTFPSPDSLDISAICHPAWQIGGDLYDVFQLSDDRVAIILGDVSGKGLPAALLMGLLHGAVRTGADGHDLEAASRRLNELIFTSTAVERFVTMFWCHYSPGQQRLWYVNAGHLAPFVLRAGGTELERLEEGGPVLGVIPQAQYRQGEVELRPGDVLVIYSDGVVEAENAHGEEFGEERLAAIIRENSHQNATDLRDTILAHVRHFVREEPQQDDLTLLVVRPGARVESLDEVETAALSAV